MRGGEPITSDINDAFPLAIFVHVRDADDIKLHHLQGQLTVILVDSIVNTGKTIVEFVQHVRKLHATIRIVIVADIIQAQCVSGSSTLNQTLALHAKLHLIALRLSDTNFTGSGTRHYQQINLRKRVSQSFRWCSRRAKIVISLGRQ